MGNPQPVKKLNDVHIMMLDYCLANPGCKLEQISAACGGYSIGWISQIYNSDAFQALLKERQAEVWGDVSMQIKDRVLGLAHVSLKRLEEKVQVEQDTDKVANVADLALKSLGFGAAKSPAGGSTTHNTVIVGSVDKASLEAARQLMHKPAPLAPVLPVEKEINPLPEAVGVQPQ